MPAFCSCCGAEITLKAEACPVCGAPRHGMIAPSKPSEPSPQHDRPARHDSDDSGASE